MNPSELEFVAENEVVNINPRFKMDSIDLLDRCVGPFHPNIPTEVPFWLAIHFRQQQKCRILPPNWLQISFLKDFKEAEDTEAGCTKPPHPHYTELATLLLQHAPDDVADAESVRTLIKDLWDVRVGKFISSVNTFISSGATSARVSQLTCLELATVRSLLTNSLDQLSILRKKAADTRNQVFSQTSNTDTSSFGTSFAD